MTTALTHGFSVEQGYCYVVIWIRKFVYPRFCSFVRCVMECIVAVSSAMDCLLLQSLTTERHFKYYYLLSFCNPQTQKVETKEERAERFVCLSWKKQQNCKYCFDPFFSRIHKQYKTFLPSSIANCIKIPARAFQSCGEGRRRSEAHNCRHAHPTITHVTQLGRLLSSFLKSKPKSDQPGRWCWQGARTAHLCHISRQNSYLHQWRAIWQATQKVR